MSGASRKDPALKFFESLPPNAPRIRMAAFHAIREGRAVEVSTIVQRVGLPEATVREALSALGKRGGVALDDRGRVIAVGGLSLERTIHSLILSGVPLSTWCAIDAIGIPAALGEEALVETPCAKCGLPIRIRMEDGIPSHQGRPVAWLPEKECSTSFDELCPEMNVFCDSSHLDAWWRPAGEAPGQVLSLEEVAALGRHWWAPATGGDPTAAC